MARYIVKRLEPDRRGNNWCVLHKPSNHWVTWLGVLASATKSEAESWAETCELVAPFDNAQDCTKALVEHGVPRLYSTWLLWKHGYYAAGFGQAK